MGNTIAHCCSTDKMGHEDTSTTIPRRSADQKRSSSLQSKKLGAYETQKPCSLEELTSHQGRDHILKCSEMCRDCSVVIKRTSAPGSTVLDTDHQHHRFYDDEHQGHNMFDGKQGLMVNQFEFSDREIRAVFS